MSTWIMVADGSRGRFFSADIDRSLEEVETMVAPEYRLQNQDMLSDRGGRSYDSRGKGRHAMEPRSSAHEQEAIDFSKRLAHRLEELRLAGEIDRLALVSPPKFLGYLRSNMTAHTLALVACSVDKELTQASMDTIVSHVPESFWKASVPVHK